jgi:hypothetical protein
MSADKNFSSAANEQAISNWQIAISQARILQLSGFANCQLLFANC